MSYSDDKYILVFVSYNQAMLLYNLLLKKGCNVELVSTPCRISSGCSQSVMFTTVDINKVIEEAKNSKVVIKGIYKIIRSNGINQYVHI